MLTGNKNIDIKILNELEDVDLVKFFQVNKQGNSICEDQVFWMNRVFNRFGYVSGNILRKYKGNKSWSEYYIDLIKYKRDNKKYVNKYLTKGSKNGRLDQVIIALKNGANIHAQNDKALRRASKNGHLEVVKYLVENKANIHAKNDEL